MTDPILVNAERQAEETPNTSVENSIESPPVRERCAGCGLHHGSVMGEIQCMRKSLARLDEITPALQAYTKAVKARNLVQGKNHKWEVKEEQDSVMAEVEALRELRKVVGK
jgi:hypothetical protein